MELAPVTPVRGTWITPVRKDPIDVPVEEKIALLLKANDAALKVKGVGFVTSSVQALREIKTLVTSEGTNVTQTFIRVGPAFAATAVGNGDFQTFEEELAPRGEGWTIGIAECPECRSMGVMARKLRQERGAGVYT